MILILSLFLSILNAQEDTAGEIPPASTSVQKSDPAGFITGGYGVTEFQKKTAESYLAPSCGANQMTIDFGSIDQYYDGRPPATVSMHDLQSNQIIRVNNPQDAKVILHHECHPTAEQDEYFN